MTIAQYMQEFVDRSSSVLRGRVSASITLRDHGLLLRTASSDERAARCDLVETRAGAGPCLSAMDDMVSHEVDDLTDSAAPTRWSAWADQARQDGFRSALAVPAAVSSSVEVAFNLYSEDLGPWPVTMVTAAGSYAELLAAMVRLQVELTGVDDAVDRRYADLPDSTVVAWAVGAVMECNRCSAEEALHTVTAAGLRGGRSERETSESILRALAPPLPPAR